MKSSKFMLAVIAILITAGTVFAFTTKKAHVKKFDVTYHYTSNSTSLEDMQDTSNWEINPAPSGCIGIGELPCSKVYSANWDEFIEYLEDFTDAGDLAAAATTRRSPSQSK